MINFVSCLVVSCNIKWVAHRLFRKVSSSLFFHLRRNTFTKQYMYFLRRCHFFLQVLKPLVTQDFYVFGFRQMQLSFNSLIQTNFFLNYQVHFKSILQKSTRVLNILKNSVKIVRTTSTKKK